MGKKARYHINDYYEVNVCHAKTPASCPFFENIHSTNYEEASETASKFLAEARGTDLPTLSKKMSTFQQIYERSVPEPLKLEGIRQDSILRKARTHKRRLSPEEFEQHEEYVERVTSILRKNGGETSQYFTSKEGVVSPERAKQRTELVDTLYEKAKNVPNEKKILFAGGMGGAGKTSTMYQFGVADKNDYLSINPDDFKQLMAEKGMIPKVPGLLPMEASTLVHDEASDLSYQLLNRALKDDKNVFMDVTMASMDNTKLDIKISYNKGYEINAFFVDVTPEISRTRSRDRYKNGMDDYTLNGTGYGGRPIPRFFADKQTSSNEFNSVNAENFYQLSRLQVFATPPRMFDNSRNGEPPKEVDRYTFTPDDYKFDFTLRL